MEPKDILKAAADLINERGVDYGGIEQNFERAAAIASLKLDKQINAYEVAIILESVKDARRAVSPDHYDSHIDGINYRTFALMLSDAKPEVPTAREMVSMLNGMGETK